jgi:hypothetical protein
MSDEDKFELERYDRGIPCPHCSGYADSCLTTDAEEHQYGCGREGCCARAFICRLCGRRTAMRAHAPDME